MQTAENKKHRSKYAKFYEPGLLRPDVHSRLVERMGEVSERAGIPPLYVYGCPLGKFCDERDLEYVQNFYRWPDQGIYGMAYCGNVPRIEDRMMAVAGALTRNFIEARVMTVQEVIERSKEESQIKTSVVLIPNFHLPQNEGGKIPEWQTSMLSGFLLSRMANNLQTVIYVADMKKMKLDYGPMFESHIKNHYYRVG